MVANPAAALKGTTLAIVGHVSKEDRPALLDVRHLTNIIAALRANPAINSVDRARG